VVECWPTRLLSPPTKEVAAVREDSLPSFFCEECWVWSVGSCLTALLLSSSLLGCCKINCCVPLRLKSFPKMADSWSVSMDCSVRVFCAHPWLFSTSPDPFSVFCSSMPLLAFISFLFFTIVSRLLLLGLLTAESGCALSCFYWRPKVWGSAWMGRLLWLGLFE